MADYIHKYGQTARKIKLTFTATGLDLSGATLNLYARFNGVVKGPYALTVTGTTTAERTWGATDLDVLPTGEDGVDGEFWVTGTLASGGVFKAPDEGYVTMRVERGWTS